MAAKNKSLAQWCNENNRNDLLSEIDYSNNNKYYAPDYIPNRIAYNSPHPIFWKCKNGHKWTCEVVGRTLFNRNCPECDRSSYILPKSAKYGCLTIIGDFDDYFQERISEVIEDKKELEDFLQGEIDISDCKYSKDIEKIIEDIQNNPKYICQCKCGKRHYYSRQVFLSTKHRYCTSSITKEEENQFYRDKDALSRMFNKHYDSFDDYISNRCGLAIEAWKKKQQAYKDNASKSYAENYQNDYTGTIYESLEVLECIDTNYEEPYSYGDLRYKDAYTYKIYKLYKCRCYVCGKEQNIKCSDFGIFPPTRYGNTAYNGYWSNAKCKCHPISSFQWIVNKILIENNISYRVEYSFDDLYGMYGVNKLRFDFAVFNEDDTIKCLIECQGPQHDEPIEEFGGEKQFEKQVKNDNLKEEYAKRHEIPLIKIPNKKKKYDKIEAILRENGIIN